MSSSLIMTTFMKQKEEIRIYSEFLVRLHTARWTGNNKEFARLVDKAAAYSYARTNSNFGETRKEEKEKLERTLKGLLED